LESGHFEVYLVNIVMHLAETYYKVVMSITVLKLQTMKVHKRHGS